MPRVLPIPTALLRGAVTVDDAERHGLDQWRLRGKIWRRMGPGTYLHSSVSETPYHQLEAARLRLPREAAFCGLTAAWLHGLDVDGFAPIEVVVPPGVNVSSRVGMKVRRCQLPHNEVVPARGFRATSTLRTLRDLSMRSSLTEAVVFVDMALHSRLASLASVGAAVGNSQGKQGVNMLRRALPHAEPKSESPMETRLRMTAVLGGLERPEAQVTIRDGSFRVLGRIDLYYREQRLGLEYDGATHEGSLAEDNRRQNRLLQEGIRLLRFTASDIYCRPEVVVSQIRSALAA